MKFAKTEQISDVVLCRTAKLIEAGRIDADYGGGVIKQRIARKNQGKSGGYRAIVLLRRGTRIFFVYGFAKNVRANVGASDVDDFKELATLLLGVSDPDLQRVIDRGEYVEFYCNGKEEGL